MSRTAGSGWGGGVLLYQKCPYCGKKKCFFDWIDGFVLPFYCCACKKRNYDKNLIRIKYRDSIKSV